MPVAPAPSRPAEPVRESAPGSEVATIGKSVVVKGELSGSEDLIVDGEVEGSITLRGQSLTVGPNGRVRAHIEARNVIVHGRVDGDIHATERVELRKSASLTGDIATARISIEDGAFFKGGIDIQKPEAGSTHRGQAASFGHHSLSRRADFNPRLAAGAQEAVKVAVVSLKFMRLTLGRVEHALRRAYCGPISIRALAPEVNLPLTSVAEAEHSEDLNCTPEGVLHPRSPDHNFGLPHYCKTQRHPRNGVLSYPAVTSASPSVW